MEINIISPESIYTYLTQNFVSLAYLSRATNTNEEDIKEWIKEGSFPGPSYRFTWIANVSSSLRNDPLDLESNPSEFYAPSLVTWIQRSKTFSTPGLRSREMYHWYESEFNSALGPYEALFGQGDSVFDRERFSATTTWKHVLKGTYGICIKGSISAKSIVQKAVAVHRVSALTMNGSAQHVDASKMEELILAMKEFDGIVSHFAPHDWVNSSRKTLFDDLVLRFGLEHEFPNYRVAAK